MGCRFCVDWCGVDTLAIPLVEGFVDAGGRVVPFAPWLMGAVRFVERLRMSFPWTTMLSFDFFRSRVSISVADVSVCHGCWG